MRCGVHRRVTCLSRMRFASGNYDWTNRCFGVYQDYCLQSNEFVIIEQTRLKCSHSVLSAAHRRPFSLNHKHAFNGNYVNFIGQGCFSTDSTTVDSTRTAVVHAEESSATATATATPTESETTPVKLGGGGPERKYDEYPEEFVNDWFRRKDELLSNKVGSFSELAWNEAYDLLVAVRRRTVPVEQNGVESIFTIINRLCREIEELKQRHKGKNMQRNDSYDVENENSDEETYFPNLPFQRRMLGDSLKQWRDYLKLTLPAKTSSANAFLLKQRFNQFDKLDAAASENLSPTVVLQCIERCAQAGLFERNALHYDTILEVMARWSNPKSTAHEAHQIFQSMLTHSALTKNPFDAATHPTAKTIQQLVEIWSKSGLPEAPAQADSYLHELQVWFGQTRRLDFWPTTSIFCAVMETYSRSNQHNLAFARIQELLREMKEICNTTELDTIAFTRVCHAFANCRHPDAPDAARAILDEMLQETTSPNCRPSQHTFSAVVTAYGRAGRLDDAEGLVTLMERLAAKTGDRSLRPNAVCFNALIWACARAGDAPRAEEILPRMAGSVEKYGAENDGELYQETLAGVLASWARSGEADASRRVAQIIQQLEKSISKQSDQYRMDVSIYNTLLTSYAQQQNADFGMRLAEDLICWMEKQDNEGIKPNGQSFLTMMMACFNARDPEKCENWLRKLINNSLEGLMRKDMLTLQHFNVAIAAWADSDSREASKKAASIFELMNSWEVKPDIISYNSLLSALANADSAEAEEEMDRLFDEMLKLWNEGNASLKPDQRTYNSFLARFLKKTNFTKKEAIIRSRSESIFKHMKENGVPPNNVNYNTAMTIWLNQKRPQRVEYLFQEMKQRFEAGDESLRPHYEAYITRLQAWSAAAEPKMAAQVLGELVTASESGLFISKRRPGTREFNCVLQAWLRSGAPDAAAKIEQGLCQMIEYSAQKRFDCHPDVFSYTAAISSYHKSSPSFSNVTAAERIWELYLQLKALSEKYPEVDVYRPSKVTFSAVLVGLLQSNDKVAVSRANELEKELRERGKADKDMYEMLLEVWKSMANPEKVEEIFQEMKQGFERGNNHLKPGYGVYEMRLEAWSKAGNPDMALRVLGEMISEKELGRKPTKNFNAVLVAWRQSNQLDSAEKAEESLRTMLGYGSENGSNFLPDVYSFTVVIAAYARSQSPSAGQKAWNLLNDLKILSRQYPRYKSLVPTLAIYAEVIVALARSGGSQAEKAVWNLLAEMQSKHESFWIKESLRGADEPLSKIRNVLLQGCFPTKQKLVIEFSRFEAATSRRVKRKHRQRCPCSMLRPFHKSWISGLSMQIVARSLDNITDQAPSVHGWQTKYDFTATFQSHINCDGVVPFGRNGTCHTPQL